MKIVICIFLFIFSVLVRGQTDVSGMDEVDTIEYFCSIDSSYQKALYYLPDIDGPTPLLVALHPWSSDYTNPNYIHYADYCIANDWVFIHPNFRGKNNNPDATGSEKAILDIIDAVHFAKSNSLIDTNRIYLAGASGGGHAALLTAGMFPSIWAGVSAWVSITDLVQWYEQTKAGNFSYWQDIYNSCGGDPTSDTAAYNEAWSRSPINFLDNAENVAIDLNAGINDGHGNYSVPISHTLSAFNKLADRTDTLTQNEINYFVTNASVPENLSNEIEDDPLYKDKPVLFRRTSENARVTIFDGGHEIIYNAACEWLARHVKEEPANITPHSNSKLPLTYSLEQNYPNPFNPSTIIQYSIPVVAALSNSASASTGSALKLSTSSDDGLVQNPTKENFVSLRIYDVLGREVATLIDKPQSPGSYQVQFNAEGLSSGIYYYLLSVNDWVTTKKMLLIK
jgi:hypothetical protein